MNDPDISIVIPAKDEAENLTHVVSEIATVLAGYDVEVIVVDDGSIDETAARRRNIPQAAENLRR